MSQLDRLACPQCGRDDTLQAVMKDIKRLAEALTHKPHTTMGYEKDAAYCKPDAQICYRENQVNKVLLRDAVRHGSHPMTVSHGLEEDQMRFRFETCGHCGTLYDPHAHQALVEFKASRQRYNTTLGHVIEALGGLADDE